jgi:D-alanyl-D-alanine carboxypeptidase (penicillin-binding protein 5/6)
MYQAARRVFCALAVVVLAGAAGLSLPAAAHAQLPYSAALFSQSRYAAIVVDANTGEVLYSRNADAPRYPASISKLMTLYLVFEQLQSGKLSLDDTVVMSAHAASMAPSKLGLKPGETISVDSAIRAVAVKSANDVAAALAEKVGGTESRFAALMTLRAQELGMNNTHYVNASGLPDNRQLSTARDIAILSRALMRDFPQYYSYFGQRTFNWRGHAIRNHNHLLESAPGVDGLKTGYINASGFNMAASAVRNGRRLIAVVMGGSSVATRDTHVEDLLDTGFTVMAKRDHGQMVQVAQNLFEPTPDGPVTRPLAAQGDEDQDGLQIVVDQNLPDKVSPYSSTTYRPVPRTTPRMTQIPAPRSMQLASIEPDKPIARKHAARDAKADAAKLTKASAAASCDDQDAAPVKTRGKKGKAKLEKVSSRNKARASKAKGCGADKSLAVADKDARKKGKAARVAKVEDGGWLVQVGAFRDRASAKTQLNKVSARFSGQLADAKGTIAARSNGMYRARFVGLTKEDARSACATIKSKGMTCLAMDAG